MLEPRPPASIVPSQAYSAGIFRRITRATCIVCAVTSPDANVHRRRTARHPPTSLVPSASNGWIYTCAVHRPLAFCARCLRAEPSTLGIVAAPGLALIPLAANERDPDLTRGLDLRSGAGVRAICGACRDECIRFELVRGRGVNMAPWMGSGFWEWDWDNGADPGAPLWADGTLRQRDATRLVRNEDVAGVVTQYVEYGDWTIREAIEEMEERVWSHWWTKAAEMEGLVRATARMQRMEERAEEIRERDAARAKHIQLQEDLRRQLIAAGGDDLGPANSLPDEFADDESDEDDDLLSLSDEFGLREMIFQDWARNRILEGIWLSPHMDIARYHSGAATNPEMRTLPPRVAPLHPLGAPRTPPTLPRAFPWTVMVLHDDRRSYKHVRANFYLSTPPPPSRLSYQLARAWEGGLRSVLGPALSNIVTRVVAECEAANRVYSQVQTRDQRNKTYMRLHARCTLALGERDPCRAVTAIRADRLLEILRGPEPWVEGGGWEDVELLDEGDDGSDGQSDLASCTPSPEALQSPSTMRTTPSPPPSVDGTKRGSSVMSVVGGTPVMGILETELEPELIIDDIHTQTQTHTIPLRTPNLPRLTKPLHSIPLVPTCSYHIGHQTKLVIEQLWREQTGGLWMCRCAVCVRAMAVQGVPSIPIVPSVLPELVHAAPAPSEQVWDVPMQVHVEEQEVEGKGKGVAGRKSRERERDDGDGEVGGERKRIKCDVQVQV